MVSVSRAPRKIDKKRSEEAKQLIEKGRKEYLKETILPNLSNVNYYDSFSDVKELNDRKGRPETETGLISITNNSFNYYIWEYCSVGNIYVKDPEDKMPTVQNLINFALTLKNKSTEFILKTKDDLYFYNGYFMPFLIFSVLFCLIIYNVPRILHDFLLNSSGYSYSIFHISKEAQVFLFFTTAFLLIYFWIYISIIINYKNSIKEVYDNMVKFDNENYQEFNSSFIVYTKNHSEENISEIKNFFSEDVCKKLAQLYDFNFYIDECKNGIVYFHPFSEPISIDKCKFIITQINYIFKES